MADLTAWLGELVRQVDSSLLEEWGSLRSPTDEVVAAVAADQSAPPVTANRRAFRVLVRNALFRRVALAARRNYWELGELDEAFPAQAWQQALEPYFAEHASIQTGAAARGPALLLVTEEPGRWRVRQILDDPEGDHDWRIQAEVDLDATDETGELVLITTNLDNT